VASLDRPEELAPEYHIWVASRTPWFETRDELPRHRGEREGEGAGRPAAPAAARGRGSG
jgi:hypothetical protein